MILITFWFLILDFLILQFELHICPVLSCFRSTLLFTLNSFGILALSNSRSSLIFYLEPPFYSTLIPNSTSFYSLSFFSTFFPFWVHDFSFFILYIESLISSFQFTWILNFPPFCEFHRVSQVLLSISNSILFRIHNFWNLILLHIIIQFYPFLRYCILGGIIPGRKCKNQWTNGSKPRQKKLSNFNHSKYPDPLVSIPLIGLILSDAPKKTRNLFN